MTQVCKVCSHPDKERIERAVLNGEGYSAVGKQYGISWQNVRNHCNNHLPKRMVAAFKKKEMTESLDMMSEFHNLMTDIKGQIQVFKDKGKDALTIRATDTLIRLYQTMCQFASVYYQSQTSEREQEQSAEAQKQEDAEREKIEGFTNQELHWSSWLSYRAGKLEYDPGKPPGYGTTAVEVEPLPEKRKPGRPRLKRKEEDPPETESEDNLETEEEALERYNLEKPTDEPKPYQRKYKRIDARRVQFSPHLRPGKY